MYRRRRPQREKIFFSFDAFLDVISNVIGIIIRLMLVAWVGGQSYNAAMQVADEEPPAAPAAPASKPEAAPLPPPKITDDPLHDQLTLAQAELARSREVLLGKLRALEGAKEKTQLTRHELDKLAAANRALMQQQEALEHELNAKGHKVQEASLSLEGLRQRGRELAERIKALESVPAKKKELRYHTPVSRVVGGDEAFFECRAGKVTFLDLQALLHEVKHSMEDIVEQLRKETKVSRVTAPVGAFRLRYAFERERTLLDGPVIRYGMTGWAAEPIVANRGESLAAALAPNSDFRRLTDTIDPSQTVVTFWVYPDSFEIFRALRDHLYERQIEVAGRPLPLEALISASRNGSRSRGQ